VEEGIEEKETFCWLPVELIVSVPLCSFCFIDGAEHIASGLYVFSIL
jgi:hypothetical protein